MPEILLLVIFVELFLLDLGVIINWIWFRLKFQLKIPNVKYLIIPLNLNVTVLSVNLENGTELLGYGSVN